RPLKDLYQSVKSKLLPDKADIKTLLTVTWDEDKFQIELNLCPTSTGHDIVHDGQVLHFYNYAATLRYNPEIVKLVAIDGQHRLVALKRILDSDKRDLLEGVELPV